MAKFTLLHPVEYVLSGAHGPTRRERITEVTLRPVKAGDLRLLEQFKGEPASLAIHACAALTGLTAARVKKISIDDYAPIAKEVMRRMSEAAARIGVRPDFFIPPDATF